MPRLEFSVELNAPQQAVWDFYDTVQTLPRITPPATRVRVVNPPAQMERGSRFFLIVRQPPIFVPLRWETIITERDPPRLFVDEQGKGPFAYWRHEHHFESLAFDRTRLRDVVTYTPPFWFLGAIADRLFIRRQLTALFAFRHEATRRALEGENTANTPPGTAQ